MTNEFCMGIAEILDSTYFPVFGHLVLYKTIAFVNRRREIAAVIKEVEEELLHTIDDNEELEIVRNGIRLVVSIFLFFMVAAIFSVLIYSAFPISVSNNGMILPLPGWYPYYSNGTIYYVTYAHQVVSNFFFGFLDVCIGNVYFGLISIANIQILILGNRVKNIGFVKEAVGDHNHERDYQELRSCILLHKRIIRYVDDIQYTCEGSIFWTMVAAAVIFCTSAYELTMTKVSITQYLATMVFLIAIVFELWMFSWVSNDLSDSCDNLLCDAYFCNFLMFDKRTSKMLLIFMQRTRHVLGIKVGGQFEIPLNLDTFVLIMQNAYRFLAVLQTMG